MTEIFCNEVVFHFNKKHLEDSDIPMWVLKTQGKTLYVQHVVCECPWSTKETPDNPHTKGSIKVKNAVLTIDDKNQAWLRIATLADKETCRGTLPIRVVWSNSNHKDIVKWLNDQTINFSELKNITGGCGTNFWITDILDTKSWLLIQLSLYGKVREVSPNESLYKSYEHGVVDDDDFFQEQDNEDLD